MQCSFFLSTLSDPGSHLSCHDAFYSTLSHILTPQCLVGCRCALTRKKKGRSVISAITCRARAAACPFKHRISTTDTPQRSTSNKKFSYVRGRGLHPLIPTFFKILLLPNLPFELRSALNDDDITPAVWDARACSHDVEFPAVRPL